MKLKETLNKIEKTKTNPNPDAAKKELAELNKLQTKNYLDLAKNSVDILLPANRLEYITLSDGTVGLAGTITSLVGFYDQWQKVNGSK